MSPWPGTPKSQQTPPINPPSVRFPFTLDENSTPADVHDAIRTALNGLTVHEQAFANIPAQVAAQASAAATAAVENISSEVVAGVSSFNALTGSVIYFPGLGYVNDQLGEPSYTVEQGDSGKKIIVGDSSGVTVYLDSGLSAPWFAIIDNDSSALVNLSALSGALYGAQSIPDSGFGIVFFDGADWWAGTTGSGGGGGGGGGGTVTSVGLAVPAWQSVTGSPVTTSGTLAISDNTQSANLVFGGPSSGSASAPTFRSLVAADLPASDIVRVVGITIDGGGSVPSTGVKGYVVIPYGCTITGWTVIADQSGLASVDINFIAGSGAPPTAPNIPTDPTNLISASAPVALTGPSQSAAGGSSAISTWSKTLTQWGTLMFDLTSVTTCTRVTVQLLLKLS